MKNAALCLVLCLAAGPACSKAGVAAGSGEALDLACHGTRTDLGVTSAFSTVLRVDLGSKRFCFDDCSVVFHLTRGDASRLEYHYDVNVPDADRPANRYRADMGASTMGPWPQKDDLTVDHGAYHRSFIFDIGDPAAVKHTQIDAGACTVAPFTGQPAAAR